MQTATVASGAASGSQSMASLGGDSFMTLLVAQLKQQDPLAPQDPTQWVGQLVQFNSLQQLIDINNKLSPA